MGEPTLYSWIADDMGSTLGLGSSIILSVMVGFHAKRSIAKISITSKGDKLHFTTHSFFGSQGSSHTIPVSQVFANPNTSKNIILKLGKQSGFYLVDVRGKFYDRQKLDSLITYTTDFTRQAKSKTEGEDKDVTIFKPVKEMARTEIDKPTSMQVTTKKKFVLPNKVASGLKKTASKKSKRLGNFIQQSIEISHTSKTS